MYLHVEGLEGWAMPRQLVHAAAQRPDVRLESVWLVRQQLRTHVVGRAHHTGGQLVLLQNARQAKVSDADVALLSEKQVRALHRIGQYV